MKNLISADVIRILRKPTYRIILALCVLYSVGYGAVARFMGYTAFKFLGCQDAALSSVTTVLGICIFLSVYADEFSSNSMQCLIGHGVSRLRLLIAKVVDCIVVTVISFVLYLAIAELVFLIFGMHLSAGRNLFFMGKVLVSTVTVIGVSTFSMIFLYCTKSAALATVVDTLILALGTLMSEVFKYIPYVKFWHLEDHVFVNAVNGAFVSLSLGNVSGLFVLFGDLIRTVVISVVIAFLLFRKKELDF